MCDECPNSFKLTDTELIPVHRSKFGKRLTSKIIWEGNSETAIQCKSEEEVFEALGLAFVPPNLREM